MDSMLAFLEDVLGEQGDMNILQASASFQHSSTLRGLGFVGKNI